MRHERPGIKYLLSIGYKIKDIYITNRSPDIITKNDNQGWEIKFVRSGRLYFTANQQCMKRDTNILVFDNNNSWPIDIIKFADILSGRYYRYSFRKDNNKHIKDVNNILYHEYKFTVKPTIISSITGNNIDSMTNPSETVEKVLEYILSLRGQ